MMTIGLRLPGACGRLPFPEFALWCASAGFDSIDLPEPSQERVDALNAAGLAIGTIDLGPTQKLLSPDDAVRAEGIEEVSARVRAIAAVGGTKAFCVFYPADHTQARGISVENFCKAFPEVGAVAAEVGVRFAMEGWPGPNHSAIGVTPETLRIMFAADSSGTLGMNYDPSHLVRVGVDYKRYLREFGHLVVHAHGKDTARDSEGQYLYGHLGPSVDKAIGWSGGDWRYCIPGEGDVDWTHVCAELNRHGFDGTIAIELEDFRYNNTEDGEKRGLSRARAHLLPLL